MAENVTTDPAGAAAFHDAWVCDDCYMAHHYGARLVDMTDAGDLESARTASGFPRDLEDEEPPALWWVGEGAWVTDREPLALIDEGAEVSDNTCANHGYYLGNNDPDNTCPECGNPADDDDGLQEFSWTACQGCGSTLGGARSRLAVWED